MKKILLVLTAAFFAVNSFATVHNITTSGLTYTPATLEANVGDTVMFTIAANHPTDQVSEATWNMNQSTSLSGGFGLQTSSFQIVLTEDDAPTIWYVCVNHVGSGMKGIINVSVPVLDVDSDGVNDDVDNCPDTANADQADMDSDDIGDACDDDIDGDGVINDEDDFPMDASETIDTDEDGIGNNADLDDDNDGCSDIFEIENNTDPLVAGDCTVSVEELVAFESFNIYPVPALDYINIQAEQNIATILIHDIAGKLVEKHTPNAKEIQLDLTALEQGFYSLQAFNAQGDFISKTIVVE